jgi:hypothetical protein
MYVLTPVRGGPYLCYDVPDRFIRRPKFQQDIQRFKQPARRRLGRSVPMMRTRRVGFCQARSSQQEA